MMVIKLLLGASWLCGCDSGTDMGNYYLCDSGASMFLFLLVLQYTGMLDQLS